MRFGPDETLWAIRDGGKDRLTRTLTEDEQKLSPYAIQNDTMFAERMAQGWTPEKDARC